MESLPFSLEQATEICEDFQDLVDTEFTLDGRLYLIDNVLVAPWIREDKERFVVNYYANGNIGFVPDEDDALDVILLVSDANGDEEPAFIDIRTFAGEKGIGYNFPS